MIKALQSTRIWLWGLVFCSSIWPAHAFASDNSPWEPLSRKVDAGQSFLKNEMGTRRAASGIREPFARLPLGSVLQMVADLDAALADVKPRTALEIAVTDSTGEEALGVILRQSREPKTGRLILLLNNVSKDQRSINVKPNGTWVDLITRCHVQGRFVMEPCAVRLLADVEE